MNTVLNTVDEIGQVSRAAAKEPRLRTRGPCTVGLFFPKLTFTNVVHERRFSGEPSLRESVSGISPPVEDKHQFYIDVQPMMGTSLRAKARIQINLAVKQVRDIKHVASFPDIVFPIMWFEDVSISIAYRVRSFRRGHDDTNRCFYGSGRIDRVRRSYDGGAISHDDGDCDNGYKR